MALGSRWIGPVDMLRASGLIERHFDQLFEERSTGFYPLWLADAREMLVTWEPIEQAVNQSHRNDGGARKL